MRQKFKEDIFGYITSECPLDVLHFTNVYLVRRLMDTKTRDIILVKDVNTHKLLSLREHWFKPY